MAANCPECDSEIDVDEMDVEVGDELSCSECGALIRVASDSPLELELADDDDEDVTTTRMRTTTRTKTKTRRKTPRTTRKKAGTRRTRSSAAN